MNMRLLMIIEKNKGFWERSKEPDVDAIVCTTNNVIKTNGALVMGAGIAKAFRDEFPFLDLNWGKCVENAKDACIEDYGVLIDGPRRYYHNSIYLIGVQTKRDWANPSDEELILFSCKKLRDLCNTLNLQRIICPKFGCANGGLKWADISKKVGRILDDRFVVIDFSPDGV